MSASSYENNVAIENFRAYLRINSMQPNIDYGMFTLIL